MLSGDLELAANGTFFEVTVTRVGEEEVPRYFSGTYGLVDGDLSFRYSVPSVETVKGVRTGTRIRLVRPGVSLTYVKE